MSMCVVCDMCEVCGDNVHTLWCVCSLHVVLCVVCVYVYMVCGMHVVVCVVVCVCVCVCVCV